MSKLTLFKQIGEAQARTVNADIIGCDDVAFTFFNALVNEMYPSNTSTRDWAEANMQLFYDQEKERIQIMKALQDDVAPQEIIDAIKAREGIAKS